MNYDNKREQWIDSLRGFLIILVILGHSSEPILLHKFIYSFHMAAFFVLSGYLYNNEKYEKLKMREVLKIKLKRFMLPYYVLANINLLIEIILVGKNGGVNLKFVFTKLIGIIYGRGTLNWMPNCSPLWFLMCIFIAEMIYIYIMKNKIEMYILIVTCIGIITSYVYVPQVEILPFNVSSACIAVMYLYIGNKLKKCEKNNINTLKIVGICGGLGIISCYLNPDIVYWGSAHFGNFELSVISGICISSLLIIIFKRINVLSRLRLFSIFGGGGNNTVIVLGFNYFIVNRLIPKIYKVMHIPIQINWISSFICSLIIFSMIFICSGFIERVYRKNE